MRTTATTKILIFAIMLLLLSIGVSAYTFFKIDQQGKTLMVDLKSLRDHYQLQSEYQKLRMELDETEEARNRLSSLVLEDDNGAVEFLSLADWLAKDLSLTLTTRKLEEKVTPEAGFDELFVEFGVTGDARSALKLVQLLELLPYHSSVVELSFARKDRTASGPVEATVGLKISIKEK